MASASRDVPPHTPVRYERTDAFARSVARLLEGDRPGEVTSLMATSCPTTPGGDAGEADLFASLLTEQTLPGAI